MPTWSENYVAGLLRERAAARTSGDKDLEAAVARELANYGHADTKSAEPTDDVAQTRTSPPKGRTSRPRQTAE